MPVPVKNHKKPLPPPKEKFPRDFLEGKSRNKLRGFCRRKNLPYALTIEQMIENILLWQKGKKVKHPEMRGTYEENNNRNHREMTPQMRQFCLEYASCIVRRTQQEWAEKFEVSRNTIIEWLNRKDVGDLIGIFRSDREEIVTEEIALLQLPAAREMGHIVSNRRYSPEVRRKMICDTFDYGGRIRANTRKVVVSQKQVQAQGQVNFDGYTDEELKAELKELKELREA